MPRRNWAGAKGGNQAEASEIYQYASSRMNLSPWYENARKKLKKGKYSHTFAIKLFQYAADRAMREYAREYQMSPATWASVATRKMAAERLVRDFESKHGHEGTIGNPSIFKPKLGKWIPVHAVKFLPGGKTQLMR